MTLRIEWPITAVTSINPYTGERTTFRLPTERECIDWHNSTKGTQYDEIEGRDVTGGVPRPMQILKEVR